MTTTTEMPQRTKELRGDRCQCMACREWFNSTYAFDRHRVGPYTSRECLTAAEMLDKCMAQRPDGFWTSGAMPDSRKQRTQSSGDLDGHG